MAYFLAIYGTRGILKEVRLLLAQQAVTIIETSPGLENFPKSCAHIK